MTTYDPEDQAERRRVLQNDTRVRDQSRRYQLPKTSDRQRAQTGWRSQRCLDLSAARPIATPTDSGQLPSSRTYSGAQQELLDRY